MIQGSLVPNITIFTEDGDLDLARTRWHIDWMFSKGVDGLFLTGSYGAGPLMTNEERIQIFELARDAADAAEGHRILLPHVGCIDTKDAVILAKAAEKVGVDAVGAVPPFYYKHNDASVIEYYRQIIEAVDVPVYAYNNPQTSRYTMSLRVVDELKKLGLAGLKDSPLSLGFITRVAYEAQEKGEDFQVIMGTSTGWLPLYYMGVRAAIAGINNWAPEIMTELVRATVAGEDARARKAYLVMMDLSEKLHFTDSTIASHMALYARGFEAGFPRQPMLLPEFGDPKYRELRDAIKKGFDDLDLEFETGGHALC
jgi:dihydrodipicolinate synthase/N-acetylneuraminate lyase